MKMTLLVKVQKFFKFGRNYYPDSYIIDVEGDLNADAINDCLKERIDSQLLSRWYVEDIKIIVAKPKE